MTAIRNRIWMFLAEHPTIGNYFHIYMSMMANHPPHPGHGLFF